MWCSYFLVHNTSKQRLQYHVDIHWSLKGDTPLKALWSSYWLQENSLLCTALRGAPFYCNTTFTRHTLFLPHLLPFMLLSMYDHYKKITDKDDRMKKVCLSVKLLQGQIAVFPHECQKWDVYSSCKRRFIVTDKMQEEQTGTSAKLSGRPKYQGLFFSPAKRLVSTDRDLPTNLTQSCKPAAVGMFAYSGSVNICFYRMGPYSAEDNFKQLFGQLQTCMYSKLQYTCARKVPLRREKEPVENIQSWSHYDFEQREEINK